MSGKIVILAILIQFAGWSAMQSQDICVPSESYADSSAGVYPLPYHEILFPDGGIHDTVCIGQPFEFTFTAVLEDSISWMGFSFLLNSLEILPNGVLNLPAGLQYGCNPPNCVFTANSMGCLKIYGTATEDNVPGSFDLQLRAKIVVANGLISVIDTLPELLVPGSHYYLPVEPSTSIHCQASGLQSVLPLAAGIRHEPQFQRLAISLNEVNLPWIQIDVIDMTGKVLMTEKEMHPGQIPLTLDISGLGHGLYFCRVHSPFGFSGLKFVVMK